MSKINKNTIPEGFTMSMALVDAIPVLFFGIDAVLVGIMFQSPLFIAGAILCFLSGFVKVLWKAVVALAQKNIWPMFMQMRILMPISFVIMLVSVIVEHSKIHFNTLWHALVGMPQGIMFGLGVLGMVLMSVFAIKLDSSDAKSNWIEQGVNGAAQIFFFIGLLMLMQK